jgi:hypothetical protein
MKWNLRLTAANRGVWKASDLQRPAVNEAALSRKRRRSLAGAGGMGTSRGLLDRGSRVVSPGWLVGGGVVMHGLGGLGGDNDVPDSDLESALPGFLGRGGLGSCGIGPVSWGGCAASGGTRHLGQLRT